MSFFVNYVKTFSKTAKQLRMSCYFVIGRVNKLLKVINLIKVLVVFFLLLLFKAMKKPTEVQTLVASALLEDCVEASRLRK